MLKTIKAVHEDTGHLGNIYEVRSDIPLPETAGKKPKYPLEQMNIGDSFSVPRNEVASLRASITYRQNRSGGKYSVRSLPNGEVRVWRIA